MSELLKTENGEEYIVALKMNMDNKKFIVTIDRKVLVEDEKGNVSICKEDDEIAKILYDSLTPPISLDIEL